MKLHSYNISFRFFTTICIGAALIMCFVAPAGAAQPVPEYNMTVLGPASTVQDMNERGKIVGWLVSGSIVPTENDGQPDAFAGHPRAFVVGTNTAYEQLPLPDGYVSSWAFSINDTGLIVGAAAKTDDRNRGRAVLWTPNRLYGYDVQFLRDLIGFDYSIATAINNSSQIVGVAIHATNGETHSVWFNPPNAALNITDYGAPDFPQDINNRGIVVGLNGDLFDLNTLEVVDVPDFVSYKSIFDGYAINDLGEVVGMMSFADGSSVAVCFTRYDKWELLGPSSFTVPAMAYDVNNAGEIVLETVFPGEFDFTLAVYFPGAGLYPVQDLLAPGQQGNWQFTTTFGADINDNRQIATIVSSPLTLDSEVAILTPVVVAGDLDRNGVVDVNDLLILLQAWGPCGTICEADLDGNGAVDTFDLLTLLKSWS